MAPAILLFCIPVCPPLRAVPVHLSPFLLFFALSQTFPNISSSVSWSTRPFCFQFFFSWVMMSLELLFHLVHVMDAMVSRMPSTAATMS